MLKTSFFSPAVFKRNLYGYWPLWAVYFGAMLLLIPVSLYSSLQYSYYETAAQISRSFFSSALTSSLIFGAFFAIFATMAVFSYMYTTRSANMTASLPVKRETLFVTNFLTVTFVTVAVHILIAVISVIVLALTSLEFLYILPILQWCILGILMTLFFICISFFCATLTGNILILPCLYGILNFTVLVINTLLTSVFANFLYGYYHNSISNAVLWLTPSMNFMRIAQRTHSVTEGTTFISFPETGTIIIYTVIGLLFLAAALLIHKNRRTESATDIIAVKPLKPVAKYFFAVVGSLTLGLVINEIFFSYMDGVITGYAVSMIIGGFIGYFASEMLVSKSFKVWHKWKGFAVYGLVVILFLVGLLFDIAGFETSIPHEDNIELAAIEIYGETIEGDDIETVEAVTQMHRYLIDTRNEEIDYNNTTGSVYISYKLHGGAIVQRSYYCNIPEFISEVYNTPQRCYDRISIPQHYINDPIVFATIEYYDGTDWQQTNITPEQFFDLYNCMISDIGTSSIGSIDILGKYLPEAVTISAEFETNEYSGHYYYYEVIPLDAKNCINCLESYGLSYNNG